MSFIPRLIATGFFTGYTPVAPGTAGSLLGLFLYWLIPGTDSVIFLVVVLALSWIGAWSAAEVEMNSGIKDNQIIVIDETVGVFVTLLLFEKSIAWLILGCILFRIFDILKIAPARQLEEIGNGWGVMLDDIAAGIYSLITLRLIYWLTTQIT